MASSRSDLLGTSWNSAGQSNTYTHFIGVILNSLRPEFQNRLASPKNATLERDCRLPSSACSLPTFPRAPSCPVVDVRTRPRGPRSSGRSTPNTPLPSSWVSPSFTYPSRVNSSAARVGKEEQSRRSCVGGCARGCSRMIGQAWTVRRARGGRAWRGGSRCEFASLIRVVDDMGAGGGEGRDGLREEETGMGGRISEQMVRWADTICLR